MAGVYLHRRSGGQHSIGVNEMIFRREATSLGRTRRIGGGCRKRVKQGNAKNLARRFKTSQYRPDGFRDEENQNA